MGVVGSAKVSASRMVIEILPVVIRAAQLNVHGSLAHLTTGGVAAWNVNLSGEMQAAGKRGWEELAFLGLHYCWYLGTVFAYLPVLKALTFVVLSQARPLTTPGRPALPPAAAQGPREAPASPPAATHRGGLASSAILLCRSSHAVPRSAKETMRCATVAGDDNE